MPYHVYVLCNPDGRVYIGQTQDLPRRVAEHNDAHDRSTLHTKKYRGPWRLVYSECVPTRSAAMRRFAGSTRSISDTPVVSVLC